MSVLGASCGNFRIADNSLRVVLPSPQRGFEPRVGAHLADTRAFTPIQIPLQDRSRVDRIYLKWFRKLWLGQPTDLDAADVSR